MKLIIKGLAAEHGPKSTTAAQFEEFVKRHYDASNPAIAKLLAVNRSTLIKTRSGLLDADAPLLNGTEACSIEQVTKLFLSEGVDMATRACKRAIEEWGGPIADVSHMVSVSCTVSSNPGYDHFVAQNLGLRPNVEKTLLAGVGCSGGMSALRLAANLVLSSAQQRKKAAVLVLACEVTSCLARAELERVASTGELHIGVSLFSDGAGALILTGEDDTPATNGSTTNGAVNGTTNGHHSHTKGVYELNNWVNMNLPDTTEDLGFDASAFGWKVILSQRVPELTAKAMPELFRLLCEGAKKPLIPAECDWAMHPGGALILKAAEKVFKLTPEHLWASWHIYSQHGNSSSPTVLQVLDALRRKEGRSQVVAAAFGPGINAEGALLTRL